MKHDVKIKKSDLERARREECKASNQLEYLERQAEEQKSQLDNWLQYRKECMEGLKTARESGLTPMYMRECQLLVKHVDTTVETIQYKVDASQENYEKSKEVWQKKNEHFKNLKEVIKQQKTVNNELIDNENYPEEVNDSSDTRKINNINTNFKRL